MRFFMYSVFFGLVFCGQTHATLKQQNVAPSVFCQFLSQCKTMGQCVDFVIDMYGNQDEEFLCAAKLMVKQFGRYGLVGERKGITLLEWARMAGLKKSKCFLLQDD